MIRVSLFIVFLLIINMVKGQWQLEPSGTDNALNAICFTDAQHGYAVGNNGSILKTTNGGTNWSAQLSGTSNAIFSINCPNSNTAYSVGKGNMIIKTTDNGNNWIQLGLSANANLESVYFIDSLNGYAAGHYFFWNHPYGIIIKTTNGGENWDVMAGIYSIFNSIFFTDVNTGYAAGYDYTNFNGAILKTTNGGDNWVNINIGIAEWLYSVFFINENIGYSVGAKGTILKTTNSGANWSKNILSEMTDLNSVFFANQNVGYAVGYNGAIIKTTDSGENWVSENSGTNKKLNSIYITKNFDAFIAGDSGTILKSTANIVGYNFNNNNIFALNIHPNPCSERLTIEITLPEKESISICIKNLSGLSVTEKKSILFRGFNTEIMDIHTILPGIYYLTLQGKTLSIFKKIVIVD